MYKDIRRRRARPAVGSKQVLGTYDLWEEGRGRAPCLSLGKGTYFPTVMYPGSFVCRQGGGGVTNKHNSPERHGLVDLDSQLTWGLASRLGGLSDVSLSPTSCQPDLGRKPGEIQITVLVQSSFDRSHGGLGPFSPNNCREDICHSALSSGDSLHPWSPWWKRLTNQLVCFSFLASSSLWRLRLCISAAPRVE